MSKQTVKVIYGSDEAMMTWDPAQASEIIRVNGVATPYQTADARHSLARAVALIVPACWGDNARVDDATYEVED